MKRLIAIPLLFISLIGHSQDFLSWKFSDRYFSLTIGTGSASYFGDVTSKLQTAPSTINLGYEARLLSRVAVRLEGYKYKLNGRDSWAEFGSSAEQRNHKFSSKNWEANMQLIYYLKPYQGDYYRRWQWDPYIGTGIGITTYDPTRDLRGETYFLRDLPTEEHKENYGTTSLVIPLIAGIKFKVNDFTNLNFELGYRIATSDYLDDVSGVYADLDDEQFSLTVQDLANPKDLRSTTNQDAYDQFAPGAKRGNNLSFDSYLLMTLKLEIFLPRPLFSGGLKKSSAK